MMRCSWIHVRVNVFSLFMIVSMYIEKINCACSTTIECIDSDDLNQTLFRYVENNEKDFFNYNARFEWFCNEKLPIGTFSDCKTDFNVLNSGCQLNAGSNSYRIIYEKCWLQGENPCHYSNDVVLKYSFESDTGIFVPKNEIALDWNPMTNQCEIKMRESCDRSNNIVVTCLHEHLSVCPKYEFFGCEKCDSEVSFVAEPTSFALPLPLETIITNRTGIDCDAFPLFCPSNCNTFSFPCCIPQLSPSLPPPPVIADSPLLPPSPPVLPPPPTLPPLASDVLSFKGKTCYQGIPITETDLNLQSIDHPQILFACVPPSPPSNFTTVYDDYRLIDDQNNIKQIEYCYKTDDDTRNDDTRTFSLVPLRDANNVYQCDLEESCEKGYFRLFCENIDELNCDPDSQLIRTGVPCENRPLPPLPPNNPPSPPPPPPPLPPPPPIDFESGFPMCSSTISSSCTTVAAMINNNKTDDLSWSANFILPNGQLDINRVNSWLKEYHGHTKGKAQIVQWAYGDFTFQDGNVIQETSLLYFWTKYACKGILFETTGFQNIQTTCAYAFDDPRSVGASLPELSNQCGTTNFIGGIQCNLYRERNINVNQIFSYNSSEYNIFDPPPLPPPPPPIPSFICVERFKPKAEWVQPFVMCKELDVYGNCKVNNNQIFEQFIEAEMIFMWCGLNDFPFTNEDCIHHLSFDQINRDLNSQTFESFVRPFDPSCPEGMSAYYCKCKSFSPPSAPITFSPLPLPPPPPPPFKTDTPTNFKFPECQPSDVDIYYPTPCGYNIFRDCQPSACEFYAEQANQTGWTYGYPEARFWTSQPIPGIFDTTAVESTLDVNNSYYCPKFACRVTCKKSCIQIQAPSNPPSPSFPPEVLLPWYLTLPWWSYLVIGILALLLIVIAIIFAPIIFTKECLQGILTLISALRGANIPGLNPKILDGIETGINQSQNTFANLGNNDIPLEQRLKNAGKDAKSTIEKMKI